MTCEPIDIIYLLLELLILTIKYGFIWSFGENL